MTGYRTVDGIPRARYGLIMADPPWRFQNWGDPSARSPDAHYQTMTLDDIKALPVYDLAARDCWLWLWTTASQIRAALDVVDAWGFAFSTMGTWGKVTQSLPVRPHIGTGHVLRECAEPYIIARKGRPKAHVKPPSLILAAKRQHSEKPNVAFKNAENLAGPNAYRLEMFSRRPRPGWDSHGLEWDLFHPYHG